jgi:hypothetical protein
MFRKKFACVWCQDMFLLRPSSAIYFELQSGETHLVKLVTRSQDNWGQEEIEKELVVESETIADGRIGTQSNNQPYKHACHTSSIMNHSDGRTKPTSENRQDRFVHCLDLPLLEYIAREQSDNEEYD